MKKVNLNTQKIDSNKLNELKKVVTINQRKEEIKNDLKTSIPDLSILDKLNLNSTLEQLKKDIAIKSKNEYLLRNCNDSNKEEHRKLRGNQRSESLKLISEILKLKLEKNYTVMIPKIKSFIKLYIEKYTKNDFSKESFYSGNMEQINKDKFNDFINLHKMLIENNLL